MKDKGVTNAMKGKIKADELFRLFYRHPLNAFPILDDALSFAGLLERRYVEAASRTFGSDKTTVKQLIDRYVSHPVPGDIVKRIFGKTKIQPMPVLRVDGTLLGVWELSAFFRVFDSVPLSAHLDFKLIFDELPLPVLILDSLDRVLSFNRAFTRFSGIHQDDRRVYRRKRKLVFRDLDWQVAQGSDARMVLSVDGREYPVLEQKVEGGIEPLNLLLINHLEVAAQGDLTAALVEFEREYIMAALARASGNISAASVELGIPRQTLQYRLTKFKIDPSCFT